MVRVMDMIPMASGKDQAMVRSNHDLELGGVRVNIFFLVSHPMQQNAG